MLGPVIYIVLALLLWFTLMLVPSALVIFFTHKNYLVLKSPQFWQIAGATCLPSVIGLVVFLAIYPFLKASGEGGIAGLAFIFVGAMMFCISTARYAYRYPNVESFSFLDAAKFGSWPYLIGLGVAAIVMVLALVLKLFNR
jgi:hypothetical protein